MSVTVQRIPIAPSADARLTAATSPVVEWLPVGVLTVLALGLRLSQLHQSLLGDEIFTYKDVVGHTFSSVLTTVHTGGENSPPLFFLLAWAAAKLGDPTVWIRLPSVVLGSATVPVVYAIGRATVGRVAGLIGAAVLAVAPFAVFYGIEARPYGTMMFFVALSTLAVVRATSTGSRRWWALYTVSAAAAAYSHYTSIFVLAVQGAWSLWVCRDRLRAPVFANALVALLYAPWLPELHGSGLYIIGLVWPLSVQRVLVDLLRPIPGTPLAALRTIPTVGGLIVVGGFALAGLVGLGIRAHDSAAGGVESRFPHRFGLIVLLTLATPVGLLLYSLLATDIWMPRGLSASLPAAALVLGTALATLPRPLTAVSAAAVIATLLFGSLRSFEPAHARGPFRTIASDLDRVAGARDPVVIDSYLGGWNIPVQLKRAHLIVSPQALGRYVRPGRRVYVVIDGATTRAMHVVGSTPHIAGLQPLAERQFATGSEITYPTWLLTYRGR